jgi:hypothetical protein
MIALIIAILMVVLPLLIRAQQGAENTLPRRPHSHALRPRPRRWRLGLPMGFIPHVFFPDKTA